MQLKKYTFLMDIDYLNILFFLIVNIVSDKPLSNILILYPLSPSDTHWACLTHTVYCIQYTVCVKHAQCVSLGERGYKINIFDNGLSDTMLTIKKNNIFK